jgi:hypothetical protein
MNSIHRETTTQSKPPNKDARNAEQASQAAKETAMPSKPHVVTLSGTPTPNTVIEPSDCSEVFRYVRHADVPRFTAEGWEPLPALDGTHHGEYSVLMRRVEQG